jgi:hypothetical protein
MMASALFSAMKPRGSIVLLVALCIAIVPATAIARGPRTGAVYVALGDSYAAGEGLGPFQNGTDEKKGMHRNQCHRSESQAYADLGPAVVLPTVTSRAFWACSGATIEDMERAPPQSGPSEQYQQPQQTQTVGPRTQWITLSVGGDDVGFGAIGTACGGAEVNHLRYQRLPGQPSCTQEIAAQGAKLRGLESELEELYNRLLAAAPQARLAVVGYPRIFAASYPGLPVYQGKPFCILDHYPVGPLIFDIGMPASDAEAIDRFEVTLNNTIQRATMMASYPADGPRIRYADTYDASVPRNCNGTTPHASVEGLVLSPRFHGIGPWYKALIGSGSFHPTEEGQRMMADVVETVIANFRIPTPSPASNMTPVSLSTLCENHEVQLHAVNGCPYLGTSQVGSDALERAILIEDNNESVLPTHWNLIDFPTTSCSSIDLTFGMPTDGSRPGDTASVQVSAHTLASQSATVGYGHVAKLEAALDGHPWSLENAATSREDKIAINGVASCSTPSGY